MRILAVSGSIRAGSSNTALLNTLALVADERDRVEIFTGLGDLPIFSPDLEGPPGPLSVEALAKAIQAADAVVIACPEYARTIPGGMKNAIDWMVSRTEIIHKPVALLHASGRGDEMLEHLRRVLETVSSRFAPQIFFRVALRPTDPVATDARLGQPDVPSGLRNFLEELREWTGESVSTAQ